ncbi:DUF6545 domain-containing protein [Streptomyces sp. KR80]|uniref:DUF6545 domain-containing protein n=1 Tax=Streptomyces sp. KR80 TaxID=3457426 RepID=UPI003FD6B876
MWVAGLTGDMLQAGVEAARLGAALRAKARAEQVSGRPVGGDAPPRHSEDYASEVDWLLRIARAYAGLRRQQGAVRHEVSVAG